MSAFTSRKSQVLVSHRLKKRRWQNLHIPAHGSSDFCGWRLCCNSAHVSSFYQSSTRKQRVFHFEGKTLQWLRSFWWTINKGMGRVKEDQQGLEHPQAWRNNNHSLDRALGKDCYQELEASVEEPSWEHPTLLSDLHLYLPLTNPARCQRMRGPSEGVIKVCVLGTQKRVAKSRLGGAERGYPTHCHYSFTVCFRVMYTTSCTSKIVCVNICCSGDWIH